MTDRADRTQAATGACRPPGPAETVTPTDPTEIGHWRGLRQLLQDMDDQIAELYRDARIDGYRPRFSMPLIRLHRRGPMTIARLAEVCGVTHSAMSQTVAAMRSAGFVRTLPGADARSKHIAPTARARTVIDFLEAEWAATERAVARIEAEIPYPLSTVVDDIRAALARRGFADRIRDQWDHRQ